MSFFYNIALFLLMSFLFFQKKRKKGLWKRLGFQIPDPKGKELIWIHAVSVGEIKSAKILIEKIQKEKPSSFLLVTTTTMTGEEEAKRELKVDWITLMPLDFSFIIRKWCQKLKPKWMIFIESDFWFHLLKYVKEYGGKNVLVSAKISSKSQKRFLKFPKVSKVLFSYFDRILVQNRENYDRFVSFVSDSNIVQITGNLKFESIPIQIDKNQWAPFFSKAIYKIAITCTHAPEEEELLDALEGVCAEIFLAPRHPERFDAVASFLQSKKIPFIRWSQIEKRKGDETVILIDQMGILPILYSFCDLTISAGSFSSKKGGHNLLEPIFYGSFVLFGPFIHSQKEIARYVIEKQMGIQVEMAHLKKQVQLLQENPIPKSFLSSHPQKGAILERTWELLSNLN